MQSISEFSNVNQIAAANVNFAAGATTAARVENVSKNFGAARILENVNFTVAAGESLVLLGASGSGKTTLLRIVAGLETADVGRVILGGADVTDWPANRRNVGVIFQNYALFPKMTVGENIGFGLLIRGVKRAAIALEVKKLTRLVRLDAHTAKYPAQLSGGQQQRVAIARALAYKPQILLFDESFNALDAQVRADLRGEIRELLKKIGTAAVFITHDRDEALELADRVAILNSGKIEQVGTPFEIYQRPRTAFVAGFLGAANLLAARFENGAVCVNGNRLPALSAANDDYAPRHNEIVKIVFRPEDVVLSATADFTERRHKIGYGTIETARFAGAHERLAIRLELAAANGEPQPLIIAAQSKYESAAPRVRTGDRVFVSIRDFRLLPS